MKKFLLLLMCLMTPVAALAVIMVQAESAVDKDKVELGETLTYTITVTRQGGGGESPRVSPPSFEGFRVQGTYSGNNISIINGVATVSTQLQFVLMAIKSGEVVIQPAIINVKNQQTGKYDEIKTKPVTIFVKGGKSQPSQPVLTPTSTIQNPSMVQTYGNIREIKYKLDFNFGDVLPYFIFVILLIIGLYLLWRKIFFDKKNIQVQEAPKREAYREALIRIKKAGINYKKGGHKELYSEIYEALRLFLSDKYGVSLYELTTNEILKKTGANYAKEILLTCDLVKFGNYIPSDNECREIVEDALKIIEENKGELS